MPVHVFALILILTLSTLGMSISTRDFYKKSQVLIEISMLLPHHSPPLPQTLNSPPLSLPLAALRHWGPHRNSLRPSPTDRLRFPDGPLPPFLLE